ncbi:hypothetical protein ACP275_07G066600 [Erythranthe tilingii]
MPPTRINVTLFFLILLSFNFIYGIEARKRRSHSIKVFNRMSQDTTPVTVHCASGDYDVGNRTLYYRQDFNWQFKTNFWGTTLFFCRFWWGPKTKAFDVFKAKWDRDEYHHTYTYEVNEQGFYVGYDEEPSDQMHGVNNWE